MRPIKEFNEFIDTGTVKKQSPNKSRAEFLIKEAEISFEGLKERIEKMGVNRRNANSIVKDCYDIIMELIRAEMLLKGYNATGIGAHGAEVSYMRVLGFNEKTVQFADLLRYFRNGTVYYGTILDEEYAEKVIKFAKENYPKLRRIIK